MDLIAIGGAQVIDNTQTFESIFTSLYQDFNKRKEVSDKILTVLKVILEVLKPLSIL
jgi:hypothetical protein